jgi:hypothetical protein
LGKSPHPFPFVEIHIDPWNFMALELKSIEIHHFWQAIHLPTPLPSCTLKTACAQLRLKSPRRFTFKSFSNSTDLAAENVVETSKLHRKLGDVSKKSCFRKGFKIANFKKFAKFSVQYSGRAIEIRQN